MFNANSGIRGWLLLAVLGIASASLAHADEDEDERNGYRFVQASVSDGGSVETGRAKHAENARWKEECGSCHIAYPARFLSAESWRKMMAGLDKHFGTDASVDAAVAAEIMTFLEQNASRKERKSAMGDAVPLRISETRWFQSEHRRIAERTWKDARVKSPANCIACHTRSDSGKFGESSLVVPR